MSLFFCWGRQQDVDESSIKFPSVDLEYEVQLIYYFQCLKSECFLFLHGQGIVCHCFYKHTPHIYNVLIFKNIPIFLLHLLITSSTGAFPMSSSSSKCRFRLHFCNRKSIYIFIKWRLIKKASASSGSLSHSFQAKVSCYLKQESTPGEFHSG